jgi:hypothetical protein
MQALAYLVYFRQVLVGACLPNGMSWLLWTCGTLVLLAIEADSGAPISVLLLPAVCAFCSFVLAVRCLVLGSYIAPDPQDWAVLALDAAILLGYAAAAYGPSSAAASLGLIFVMLPGLSSTVASWPILRTTFREPGNERPTAWFVWSAAYGLSAVTVMAEGLHWAFLAYPLLNQAVHILMGFLAMNGGDSPAAEPGRT